MIRPGAIREHAPKVGAGAARATARTTRQAASAGNRFGYASMAGLGASLALLATAMVMGGQALSFLDGPSLLIVVGGTATVTLTTFSPRDLAVLPGALADLFREPRQTDAAATRALLVLAESARRDGIMTLEAQLAAAADRPVLRRGLEMSVDAAPADTIARALDRQIAAALENAEATVAILRRAADVAPAMGLIGTLLGLVQMLGQLDDPAQIGPAMALALLTTFYGAVLAHVLLVPLAERVDNRARRQALRQRLELATVLSIARGENPRQLEAEINTMLPPGERVEYFG